MTKGWTKIEKRKMTVTLRFSSPKSERWGRQKKERRLLDGGNENEHMDQRGRKQKRKVKRGNRGRMREPKLKEVEMIKTI